MPPSLQALGAHSKKLTVELDDKAVALAVAQASQELALRSSLLTSRIPFHSFSNNSSELIFSHSRMRALEADKMALKNVIKDSEKEEKSKVDVIEVIFEQHVHL